MDRIFNFKNLSLRVRIFLSMIFLTLIASVLIATVSIYQFRKEAREYHQDRLERKETAIAEHINYVLQTTTYPLSTENIPLIFKEKIFELADIHSMEINFFDLKGKLLISSKAIFKLDKDKPKINPSTLRIIQSSLDKRYIEFSKIEGQSFRSSYTYLKDTKFKPMGILNLPYEENTEFYDNEVQNFLIRFGQVYVFMFLISIILSYFLSSYITKSLKIISDKMQETQLNQRNEKIVIEDGSKEINLLIKSYNNMVDKLEESATILAQSEREQAWREMAKQVAHEIKNPLTPMKLSLQHLERAYDSGPSEKLDTLFTKTSKLLVEQIDSLSNMASEFSDFAKMPEDKFETFNISKIMEGTIDLFRQSENVDISTKIATGMYVNADPEQVRRIFNNLIKNAIQAIPENKQGKIEVHLIGLKKTIKISVKDNGTGILKANFDKVFVPNFSTKNSGMGLGLAICRKITETSNGSISFISEPNKGTTFTVNLPRIENN